MESACLNKERKNEALLSEDYIQVAPVACTFSLHFHRPGVDAD